MMPIVNTWSIAQLDAYPEYEGNTDVVFTAHWRLSATDGTYNGSVYGTVGLTLDPESPFTAYADLTEATVIGWVQDALGEDTVAAHEANVAQQIADQIAPPVVSPPLPWA